MNQKKILLTYGGESPEHDVSIRSARTIYNALDQKKYKVYLCYIDRSGKWWLLPEWIDDIHQHGGSQIYAALGEAAFIVENDGRALDVDVIYPAMHGDTAEDGVMQGLARLLHIPIVGSDGIAHAVGWDKLFTKQVLSANNLPIVPYLVWRVGEDMPAFESCVSTLNCDTLFVKPTRAGSSIGVSKVTSGDELSTALRLAGEFSQTILIEKAVIGRELEIGVLGNPPDHQVTDVGEIVSKDGFYTYDEKYASDSKTEVLTHTDLASNQRETLREMARCTFSYLGCKGQARIDFFLESNTGQIYINEVNTLPGFTSISQYPKLWQEQGIEYPELVDKLITLALQ